MPVPTIHLGFTVAKISMSLLLLNKTGDIPITHTLRTNQIVVNNTIPPLDKKTVTAVRIV